ncbi:hypothetical protein [Maridesulfovibrio ferrireducens]|uniref:hypothetical protein n=1 Tax=Maridesulfovibrio ferrireducens TaxID=246191 RepID=UPI001A2F1DE6|nr:hypothetical protein [Maridesulfovibrio ferrireducens]MBI9112379.1 hypothetical protein [Maridesulfovibrio ferrireducens]
MNSTIVEIANAVIQPEVRGIDWYTFIGTGIGALVAAAFAAWYTNYSLNKRDKRFLAREEEKELQATLDTANYYAQNIDLLLTDLCVFYNSKLNLNAIF